MRREFLYCNNLEHYVRNFEFLGRAYLVNKTNVLYALGQKVQSGEPSRFHFLCNSERLIGGWGSSPDNHRLNLSRVAVSMGQKAGETEAITCFQQHLGVI